MSDRTPPPSEQQARAAEWATRTQSMRAAASAVDWSKVDWSKLGAKDVGVRMGPVMTEEQFREYRHRQGAAPVHIIRGGEASVAGKKP